jgi:hypothetical protein
MLLTIKEFMSPFFSIFVSALTLGFFRFFKLEAKGVLLIKVDPKSVI